MYVNADFACQTGVCRSTILHLMSIVRFVIEKCFSPLTDSTESVVRERLEETPLASSGEGDYFNNIPQTAYLEFDKAPAATLPAPESFLDSISLRFGGFERQFNTSISPLNDFESGDANLIRNYFINSLGAVVSLSNRRPKQAQALLIQKGTNGQALYERLVAVACGDQTSVLPLINIISRSRDLNEPLLLDCLKEVGRYRPYEACHLLMSLFNRGALNTKISVIKEIVHSPLVGDKHVVGDLFVSIMANSTPGERKNGIYPGLLSIIDEAPAGSQPVMIKRGYLLALLHGWMSEI